MSKRLKIVGIAIGGVVVVGLIIAATIVSNHRAQTTEKIDTGTEISEPGVFDLSAYEKNVTIVTPGVYYFNNTVTEKTIFVDTEDETTIVLDGATITNTKTAGIVNLGSSKLIIGLAEGTTNKITGSSRSKYRAPIYSSGDIIINGKDGALVLQNQFENGAAIMVEEGKKIEVTGGTLLALTAGDYELENFDFSQKKLAFDLDEKQKVGTKINITNKTLDPVCQFEAEVEFKKILLNANYLEDEKYFLYLDEDLVQSGVAE